MVLYLLPPQILYSKRNDITGSQRTSLCWGLRGGRGTVAARVPPGLSSSGPESSCLGVVPEDRRRHQEGSSASHSWSLMRLTCEMFDSWVFQVYFGLLVFEWTAFFMCVFQSICLQGASNPSLVGSGHCSCCWQVGWDCAAPCPAHWFSSWVD